MGRPFSSYVSSSAPMHDHFSTIQKISFVLDLVKFNPSVREQSRRRGLVSSQCFSAERNILNSLNPNQSIPSSTSSHITIDNNIRIIVDFFVIPNTFSGFDQSEDIERSFEFRSCKYSPLENSVDEGLSKTNDHWLLSTLSFSTDNYSGHPCTFSR